MTCHVPLRRFLPWLALLMVCGSASVAPGEVVEVELRSGRTFKAEIDARTDDERLWLRFEGVGTLLWRPVDWDQVVSAKRGEKQLKPQQLKKLAERIKTKAELQDAFVLTGGGEEVPPSLPPISYAEQAAAAMAYTPQVRSVAADVYVANWDADVELDGIVVEVAALDEYGFPMRVDGHVDVTLVGTRTWGTSGPSSATGLAPFPVMGRWSSQVQAFPFDPRGNVFKYDFQNLQPQFDLDLTPYGLVNVRLVVPGQGVFETSADMVRLRPYSAVRDRIQLQYGERFLPRELRQRTQ